MNKQIVSTLRKFGRERRSGVLTCQGAQLTRQMMFLGGAIVGARSTSQLERMGEVLVRHGKITEQHLKDATLFASKGRRLGEVLAELRIIKTEDIPEYVRLQVLEVCSSVVIQPPKRMSFVTNQNVIPDLPKPVHVLDIVMEAARRTPRIEEHIKRLMEDDRLLSLTQNFMKLMDTVTLQPHEAFVLSRITGDEPTRSVFALSPLSEEQTARTILGHLCVGILELKEDTSMHGLAVAK